MTIKTHGRMFTDDTVGITQLDLQDGTANQAIVTDGQGVLRFATVGAGGSVGSSVYVEDIRTGDGTTATFTLSTGAPYEESILVFIDGVAQPTSSFTLPSTTSITFSPAPGNGAAIRICHLGIASSVANNSITGAHLAMGGDTAGDILFYNGTDYQRLTIGTASQHLVVNSAANAPEWASGSIIQTKYDNSNARFAVATDTSNEGYQSDVLPTIGLGSQFMSVSITPKSASNILVVEHSGMYSDATTFGPVVALFAGNTCIAAMTHDVSDVNHIFQMAINATFVASDVGWTSGALAITVRGSAAQTLTFNGRGGVRFYNTAQKSSLVVREYTP